MRLACDEAFAPNRTVDGPSATGSSRRGEIQITLPTRGYAAELRRIPIPARVWWREFRVRLMPVGLYVIVLAVVIWLWCNQGAVSVVW